MDILFTIGIFLIVLVVLVVIHELGHFLAAKRGGVRVDEFGFGFPPKLYGKKFGDTEYTVNALPLGGFVKIKGIAGEEEGKGDADSFHTQSFARKLWILCAGIVMNFALSILLFAGAFAFGVQTSPDVAKTGAILSNSSVVAQTVTEGSPAQRGGMRDRDAIVSIEGEAITSDEAFRDALVNRKGIDTTFVVERDGAQETLTIRPDTIEYQGEEIAGVGIDLAESVTLRYPLHLALWHGAQQSVDVTVQIFAFLGGMIVDLFTSDPVDTESLSGPVGLAVVIRGAADSGFAQLLQIAGLLSVNLAIFNLLPIPMLDGGRIFLLCAERLRGKPLTPTAEAFIHNSGFILLLAMVVLVTLRDIIRL